MFHEADCTYRAARQKPIQATLVGEREATYAAGRAVYAQAGSPIGTSTTRNGG